jgi:flagellar hook-associated protein 1 FlgK
MADLFALLVQSGNSLSAHTAVVTTAGNNIANANTPGYSRQIPTLTANPATDALGLGAVGTGVSLASITQARDQFVERQLPNALGAQASSQSQSDALSALHALDPDLQGGLSSTLGAFYSSLQTWSQNPGDVALRQGVLGSAQALATSFQQTASAVESARTGLDAAVAGKLNDVNIAAQKVADLNGQILIARTAGGQPNDLIDARQSAIDELATLTGAVPYDSGQGNISIALPGGTALVSDTRAAVLSVASDSTNGGHSKIRITRADGSGPVDWTGPSFGGTVGGLMGARDGALETASTSIDKLAFDLGTAVNTVHQAGFAMDGSPGLALFSLPLTSTGAASQIAVNATVAADPRLLAAATTVPAGSGDNRNVLALIATERQALAGGADPVATVQSITTTFGSSTARAKALADHDGAIANHLTTLRDSVSGVSIDEEMINLTKAQRAYQAVSKVIEVSNSLLETLMNMR